MPLDAAEFTKNTWATPSGCGRTSPTRRPICTGHPRGKAAAVRGGPGQSARRRSRHVPVRDELQQLGLRRAQRQRRVGASDQQDDRRRQSLRTRVGGGPFVTELHDAIGQHIRDVGNEYGTVTGRPRRCGWFDGVAAGYGARLSGVDSIAIALLDVLSGLKELKICTPTRSTATDDRVSQPRRRAVAGDARLSHAARLDVRHLAGAALRRFPPAAKRYIETVAELVGAPVEIVSVGPDREQTVFVSRNGTARSLRKVPTA